MDQCLIPLFVEISNLAFSSMCVSDANVLIHFVSFVVDKFFDWLEVSVSGRLNRLMGYLGDPRRSILGPSASHLIASHSHQVLTLRLIPICGFFFQFILRSSNPHH